MRGPVNSKRLNSASNSLILWFVSDITNLPSAESAICAPPRMKSWRLYSTMFSISAQFSLQSHRTRLVVARGTQLMQLCPQPISMLLRDRMPLILYRHAPLPLCHWSRLLIGRCHKPIESFHLIFEMDSSNNRDKNYNFQTTLLGVEIDHSRHMCISSTDTNGSSGYHWQTRICKDNLAYLNLQSTAKSQTGAVRFSLCAILQRNQRFGPKHTRSLTRCKLLCPTDQVQAAR